MDKPFLKAIATVLRRNRERVGMSQQQLSDHCGLNRTSYMYWENKYREPKSSYLLVLCKEAFKIPLSKFFKEVEDEMSGENKK